MDLLNIQEHVVTKGTLGKHFLIYGAPGTRKTTVASNFPKPLFLATEIGYQFIEGVMAQPIDSWYTFKQAIRELKKEEVKATYDTIIIDTLNLLSEQCAQYICEKNSVAAIGDLPFGKGWTEYRKEMTSTFNLLAQMGYGVVFISHAKEVTDDDGKLESVGPGLDNTTFNIINAMADMILYVGKGKDINDRETVFGYSNTPASIKTKSRVRNFPSKIEFDYATLEKSLISAISELGITTSETIEPIKTAKRTLDELKESIVALAGKTKEINQEQAAANIIGKSLQGVSLKDANETHYNSLMAVELGLQELIGL